MVKCFQKIKKWPVRFLHDEKAKTVSNQPLLKGDTFSYKKPDLIK